MIITHLNGGLGNQMFQYAAGRALAHRLGCELKLDITTFSKQSLRHYALECFNTHTDIATADEIAQLTQSQRSLWSQWMQRISNTPPALPDSYIKEQGFTFETTLTRLSGDYYLEGYWQSEQYFSAINKVIRDDFTANQTIQHQNAELVEQIKHVNSVSIHVRRGDYISNQHTNSVHGTCNLDYYHAAINIMATALDAPHFFIFSDDPQWVSEHLVLDHPCVNVSNDIENTAHDDLLLMSQCQHNIIANSSFSWWGAWLNNHPQKRVIAPLKWFNNNTDTSDLIPATWQRL